MAQTLLAIVLVLLAGHAVPELARWRDFSWLQGWNAQWLGDTRTSRYRPLLLPLVLVLLCLVLQALLSQVLFGLPAFAFATIVLFFAWGPGDLEADIQAVLKAPDSDRRHAALQALRPDTNSEPLPLEPVAVVEAVFASALSRWFGVLFWFVLLGPGGALGYRAVQLLARRSAFRESFDADQLEALERTARILDWVPAHLLAFTLALVSDFDAVMGTWRQYHAAHGRGYFTLDLGFLGALARAGVDADVEAGDGYAQDVGDPLVELADARTVLRRVLVVWLVLIALPALLLVGR
ncbi:regulatory signaling modulator protein AmpE [Dokdonella sp.]|uniref:regulatory signaling modulator protein AmpE n=1 Tax=Dokdonella sp. TaxID=2291710 RepID=UPI0025B906C2|nr:regulatory signaling modulator protein AmpE [Dokdonella sp.]MBX3689188.1 regulatory signaling modulator protein AmpE [Dokdonella sp.]